MPFKSHAQIAKFRELVKSGKMSQATFDEWMAAVPRGGELPMRVKKTQPTKVWKAKVIK